MLTFSIALLVRSPLDPFLALLPLRINAFFRYAVLDATETRASVVAFLASFLTIGASILDLTTLGAGSLVRHTHAGRKWIHMHGHARIRNGMHCHLRLDRVGGGVGTLAIVRVQIVVGHCEKGDGVEENKKKVGLFGTQGNKQGRLWTK